MTRNGETTAWEVPELAAAAAMVAVGLVVVSELLSGVLSSLAQTGPVATSSTVGTDVELSTQWAEPVLCLVLLVVMGVCWWQVTGWSEVGEQDAPGEAQGHIARGLSLARWTAGGLLTLIVGATASFVGAVVAAHSEPLKLAWAQGTGRAGNLLAVLAVAVVALVIGRTFDR